MQRSEIEKMRDGESPDFQSPELQASFRHAKELLARMRTMSTYSDGFRELLARRNTGSLKLPLKSHGYLYEVISGWQGQGLQTMPAAPEQRQPESSQTLNAAMTLQGLRR